MSSAIRRFASQSFYTGRRALLETWLWAENSKVPSQHSCPENPKRIFVLRNNDIGDLIIITPLFETLKKRFPRAELIAGVGDWNKSLLNENPYLSKVIPLNAPWHNKVIKNQSLSAAFHYLNHSQEIIDLKNLNCDIGIDVLGSPLGSLLLLKAAIPFRLGVRGYAGGDKAAQLSVPYNPYEHVGRSALRFAELLGAQELPALTPQIFLTSEEKQRGQNVWKDKFPDLYKKDLKIVLAPGGFKTKCWPKNYFAELLRLILKNMPARVLIVGGESEKEFGDALAKETDRVFNSAGALSLRESFSVTASADYVIANPSMLFHAAAAFGVKTLLLLGEAFPSAKIHRAQWEYDSTFSFGREVPSRDTVYTPEEAFREFLKIAGTSGVR